MGWVEQKIEHVATTVALEGERTRAELGAAFATTLRGQRLDGALARPIRPNAQNYGASGRLVGWSVRATSGEVILTLHDGTDSSGDVIGAIDLAAGQSQTISAMPSGVSFVDGLYVESTGAGVAVGALWIGAVD